MQFTVEGRESAHDKLIADSDLQLLVGRAADNKNLRMLVASTVDDYKTESELLNGGGTAGIPLRNYASNWGRGQDERRQVAEIVDLFERLYTRFEEGTLRGMIIEQMIEKRMRSRYAGHGDVIANNAFIKVADGKGWKYRSHPNSVDVVGYDSVQERGECHTCKVRAKNFGSEKGFIEKMARELVPKRIVVGLVVAQDRERAERQLKRAGLRLGGRLRLLGREDWDAAPLQQAF